MDLGTFQHHLTTLQPRYQLTDLSPFVYRCNIVYSGNESHTRKRAQFKSSAVSAAFQLRHLSSEGQHCDGCGCADRCRARHILAKTASKKRPVTTRPPNTSQHIPTPGNLEPKSADKKSAVSLPELRTSLPIRRRTPPFSAESAPPHGDISTAWQNPCKAIPFDSNLLIGLFVAMD